MFGQAIMPEVERRLTQLERQVAVLMKEKEQKNTVPAVTETVEIKVEEKTKAPTKRTLRRRAQKKLDKTASS